MSRSNPTPLKVLKGTNRRDRIKEEPRFESLKEIHWPDWLASQAEKGNPAAIEAIRYGNEIAPDLMTQGLLTTIDEGSFIMLCVTRGQWCAAIEDVMKSGATYDANGLRKINPNVRIAQNLGIRLEALNNFFGLTPTGRNRLDMRKLSREQDESKIEDFLFGGTET